MTFRPLTAAILILISFTFVGSALANIIDDTYGDGAGSFELGTYSGGPNYMGLAPGDSSTIIGWTVGGPGDGVDWCIEPEYAADSGVYCLDLQHTANSSISTDIPTSERRGQCGRA